MAGRLRLPNRFLVGLTGYNKAQSSPWIQPTTHSAKNCMPKKAEQKDDPGAGPDLFAPEPGAKRGEGGGGGKWGVQKESKTARVRVPKTPARRFSSMCGTACCFSLECSGSRLVDTPMKTLALEPSGRV